MASCHHITHTMEWASFLWHGKLSPYFLSLHLLTTFYPLLVFSMSWSISKSSFYVTFSLVSPPPGHFYPFITTTFLLYVSKFAFSKFLWLHVFQKAAVSTCPQSTTPSLLHLRLIPASLAVLSLLLLCCACTCVGQFSFWLSLFVKCHMGLSPGNKEETQIHTLLFLSWITRARWHITDRLEVVTWLVTDYDVHLSLTQWFVG